MTLAALGFGQPSLPLETSVYLYMLSFFTHPMTSIYESIEPLKLLHSALRGFGPCFENNNDHSTKQATNAIGVLKTSTIAIESTRLP